MSTNSGKSNFKEKVQAILNASVKKNKSESIKDILWSRLQDGKLKGFTFQRNARVNEFTVDFYCHEKNLIVEISSPAAVDRWLQEGDDKIMKLLEMEISFLSFSEENIKQDLDWVVWQIEGHLALDEV